MAKPKVTSRDLDNAFGALRAHLARRLIFVREVTERRTDLPPEVFDQILLEGLQQALRICGVKC